MGKFSVESNLYVKHVKSLNQQSGGAHLEGIVQPVLAWKNVR